MASYKSLILFITPNKKTVNGGVMSIFSLAKESRELSSIHKSDVEICVYPGDKSYKTNDLFDNNEYVNDFDEIIQKYPNLDSLLIHVPELIVDTLNFRLNNYANYLNSIPAIHINVMNQNIWHMQNQRNIISLYKFADRVTQTTAHDRYASQKTADLFAIPLKHLSVFINPQQYSRMSYSFKENIIAYSKDSNATKDTVLELIRKSFPDYSLIEINNMTYEEYKNTIAKARYVITFGEGLDGYLIESTFCGSIGISVYNNDFFPNASFKNEAFIYATYQDMLDNIVTDIKNSDQPDRYDKIVNSMYTKLSNLYSRKKYNKNLIDFYRGVVDFTPSFKSVEKLLSIQLRSLFGDLADSERQMYITQRRLRELQESTNTLQTDNIRLKRSVNDYERSTSWRITRPFRSFVALVRKLVKQ